MGLIAGYLPFKGGASQPWRLFLMTGILGGYTTSRHSRSMPPCSTRRARSGSPERALQRAHAHGYPWVAHGYGITSVCLAVPPGLSRLSIITRQILSLGRTPPKRPGPRRRRRGGGAAPQTQAQADRLVDDRDRRAGRGQRHAGLAARRHR